MNKQRRKALQEIVDQITSQMEMLEEIINEEQEAYDNLPESIQDSDRGTTMNDGISSLENAKTNFEYVVDDITNAIDG